MKAFKFSLESLLILRRQQKEKALQDWMEATQELQRVILLSQRAYSDLKSWFNMQREQHAGVTQVGELIQSHLIASDLQKIWFLQEQRRRNVESRVQETLRKWEEARKNEEIVEKLKQRSRQKWVKEKENFEQKSNDEWAGALVFRKTSLVHHAVR